MFILYVIHLKESRKYLFISSFLVDRAFISQLGQALIASLIAISIIDVNITAGDFKALGNVHRELFSRHQIAFKLDVMADYFVGLVVYKVDHVTIHF
jgi:hypothetical protein